MAVCGVGRPDTVAGENKAPEVILLLDCSTTRRPLPYVRTACPYKPLSGVLYFRTEKKIHAYNKAVPGILALRTL